MYIDRDDGWGKVQVYHSICYTDKDGEASSVWRVYTDDEVDLYAILGILLFKFTLILL